MAAQSLQEQIEALQQLTMLLKRTQLDLENIHRGPCHQMTDMAVMGMTQEIFEEFVREYLMPFLGILSQGQNYIDGQMIPYVMEKRRRLEQVMG